MDILTFELDSRCYALPAEQEVQSCANALIEDLLDVTRIDAKLLAIDPDSVDGSFLLEEALLDTAPLAAEKSIELAHGWEGEHAAVSAD